MTAYTISSFIRLMQAGLVAHSTQESAGRLLFESIDMGKKPVDINAKMITHLVKRSKDVTESIKKASAQPEVITNAVHYFEDVVLPDLNPHLQDDTCLKVIHLLEADATVPPSKSDALITLYQAGKLGEFLAQSFLYALSRPNKLVENEASVEDAYLVHEVKNACPLCYALLTEEVKGHLLQRYKITPLYPEHLSAEEEAVFPNKRQPAQKLNTYANKIALCPNCCATYEMGIDPLAYERLIELKEQHAKTYQWQQALLSGMTVEDDLKEVVSALKKMGQVKQLEKLNFNALSINQKIRPESALLLDDLETYVVKYYRFIEDCFARTDYFEESALDVRKAFLKFDKIFKTQEEIIEALADWLLWHTGLPQNYSGSCRVVVAFFVQNCEVFDEISE